MAEVYITSNPNDEKKLDGTYNLKLPEWLLKERPRGHSQIRKFCRC